MKSLRLFFRDEVIFKSMPKTVTVGLVGVSGVVYGGLRGTYQTISTCTRFDLTFETVHQTSLTKFFLACAACSGNSSVVHYIVTFVVLFSITVDRIPISASFAYSDVVITIAVGAFFVRFGFTQQLQHSLESINFRVGNAKATGVRNR
jgi:hypothetical protein